MYLLNSQGQQAIHDYFEASGVIATGGVAQLVLPQRKSCSHFLFQNLSSSALMIQFGVRPGIATLTNGVVTSVSVPDVGFGFLVPPPVHFLGGGNDGDLMSQGGSLPGWPTPRHPAKGRAVMSAGAISSIEINDGGSGYLAPPYVYILANRVDPTGVGLPAASIGIMVLANGGSYYLNGTACPTTAVSVYGANTGQAYTCKWMP